MEVCSVMGSILRGGGGCSPNLCCAGVCGSVFYQYISTQIICHYKVARLSQTQTGVDYT